MDNTTDSPKTPPIDVAKKPNESAGFYFSSFVKIVDSDTGEILVQTRGDN